MSILLVRHGQTLDNASGTIQVPNSPLSKAGRSQADKLAIRLSEQDIGHILCSDYQRTQQTAQPIAHALGLNVTLSRELRERNFGDLRGRSYGELDFDPFASDYSPENGESWPQFFSRVSRAWRDAVTFAASLDRDLLLVTHGFVCHALVLNHLQLSAGMLLPTKWGNTSLTVIEKTEPWTISLLNDTEHLFGGFNVEGDTPV